MTQPTEQLKGVLFDTPVIFLTPQWACWEFYAYMMNILKWNKNLTSVTSKAWLLGQEQ